MAGPATRAEPWEVGNLGRSDCNAILEGDGAWAAHTARFLFLGRGILGSFRETLFAVIAVRCEMLCTDSVRGGRRRADWLFLRPNRLVGACALGPLRGRGAALQDSHGTHAEPSRVDRQGTPRVGNGRGGLQGQNQLWIVPDLKFSTLKEVGWPSTAHLPWDRSFFVGGSASVNFT